MSDPMTWSIDLGRWAGTRVRVHAFLLIFAALKLLGAAWEKTSPGLASAVVLGWFGLLVVALACKLAAQAVMAARLGYDQDEFRVWPLGDLGRPGLSEPERSPEAVASVIAGMLVNLAIAASIFVGLRMAGAWMILNPFGGETAGAPVLASSAPAFAFTATWWFGQFGYVNWVLFLANLLPALPLDGGRIFRPYLAAKSRDPLIAPWTAHVVAIILFLVGLVRWLYLQRPGSGELFALAVMIEWMVRIEARGQDEGGFFDDGVFGYDFSQGYTSLEAGAATVRPPREGALRRWRRRREEDRRRRLEAEEAAEESRMDAILAKIHTEGRSALTPDEERFLAQVSAKFKKRARNS